MGEGGLIKKSFPNELIRKLKKVKTNKKHNQDAFSI